MHARARRVGHRAKSVHHLPDKRKHPLDAERLQLAADAKMQGNRKIMNADIMAEWMEYAFFLLFIMIALWNIIWSIKQ